MTWRGLSNKHLILSMSNGQVFAMDVRMADPRRAECLTGDRNPIRAAL